MLGFAAARSYACLLSSHDLRTLPECQLQGHACSVITVSETEHIWAWRASMLQDIGPCVHLHGERSKPPAAMCWHLCLQVMQFGLRPAGGIRCVPAACDRIKLHTPEGKPKELLTCERCQHQPIWQPVSGQVPGKRPASAAAAAAAAADCAEAGPVACRHHPVARHPSLDAARRCAACFCG